MGVDVTCPGGAEAGDVVLVRVADQHPIDSGHPAAGVHRERRVDQDRPVGAAHQRAVAVRVLATGGTGEHRDVRAEAHIAVDEGFIHVSVVRAGVSSPAHT